MTTPNATRPHPPWIIRFRASSGRYLRWISLATTIGMLVILTMGDWVVNANAAQGCGRSWPLCDGRLLPTIATPQTLIEFSHRFVVAIVSIGIIALAAGTALRTPHRTETRILAPALIFFLVLQSVLGGLAVLQPQSPPILALHLGVSLISFATVLLTALLLWGESSTDLLRDHPVPPAFRRLTWITMIYLYALIYLGAFVRHTNAQLACSGWPLCNGSFLPQPHFLILVNYAHRLSALIGIFLFVLLFWRAAGLRSSRPDLFWGSAIAFVGLLLQSLSGAYVALSGMALPAALLHGSILAIPFGALSYLCMHVLPRGIRQTATIQPRRLLQSGLTAK